MTEHPMVTASYNGAQQSMRDGSMLPYNQLAITAALQWLAAPENVSDDVVEAVAIARYVDAGVDNNDPATWVSYPEACKAEYRMSAINMITALANALIKEIEGHE